MFLRGERIFLAGIALALIAALAIGCGGSSQAAPLKKAQFITQADAICAAAQGEREAQGKEVAEQGSSSGGSEEAEAVMQMLLEPVAKMTEELGELGPPKGEEKQVEAIVEGYEEGVSKLEADPAGPESVSAFDQANKLAAEYGLSNCAI